MEKDKGENERINAIFALLDDIYENVSEIVYMFAAMTSSNEQVL